ncbi:MAG: RNA methyltransferase [Anaerolineaceae bacterium]|nr:RNA methyltransferase [Anaerolineaceae bacterium]
MITSSHNPKIQQVRALLAQRSERDAAQAFVVEGVRLCEEARTAGWQPDMVLFSQQLSKRGRQLLEDFSNRSANIEEIPDHLMDSVAGTETPQGILAIFPFRSLPTPANLDFVLVLDMLRDPGNLGTILRSAAAAGVQSVRLTPGTADPFAPKVLRSAMGAHFRLPIQLDSWDNISALGQPTSRSPLKFFLAEAEGAQPCWQTDFRQPLVLLIGGEAEGASAMARKLADALVSIPMPGRSESLNAAIAASILMFEVVRQRSS